jgi:hypothetical protein
VRTLLQAAGRQTTIGSGFVVSADGLAITNYHVVSQFALDPRTFRLEYLAPDGARGTLKLLAIDVANDLAVVKLDRPVVVSSGAGSSLPPPFEFDPRALANRLPKGERIYAMGNPLDLGFTIVEGTYNGLIDRSYDERIHFSGAINAGMSGGPVTAADGRIVGINVAKRLDGESVGFLVPARHAATLLERARKGPPLAVDKAREEVGRQLDAWQGTFYEAFRAAGFRSAQYGSYRGIESSAPWITCWAATNAGTAAARANGGEHDPLLERDRHLRLRPHPHGPPRDHALVLQGDRPERIPVRARAFATRRQCIRLARFASPHRAAVPRRLRDRRAPGARRFARPGACAPTASSRASTT